MENNYNFISDCSDNCIRKTEKYFLDKGYVITSISKISGLDNKTYGDLKVELFKDGIYTTKYIDYKKQTRDRNFIQVELIQVGARGNYDSWLYNNNINYCIYEFKDGRVFLFEHSDLIKIAKQNNTDDMWNTCIVYSKAPERYTDERNYINEKLNSYRIIKDDNNIIKADHINGAFNYHNDTKIHSGFCMNLSLDTVKNYKI
jgi:hypothetical protein